MSGGMYVLHDDEQLIEMKEQEYDSEDLLQSLLAKFPNLIPGDQINSSSPRKWLFISRELGLPSEEDGSDRWSVDHLFLDQDGIPTIIEVKRSSDSRIRREVIGQILEYGANAILYWPLEKIRSVYEANCEKTKIEPSIRLEELIEDTAEEAYWQKVKNNLQAQKIRMLIVADEIPSELRRVVEFLNEQMDPAEILCIEIKQYVSDSLKTLVPRVIGQTSSAQQRKSGNTEKRQWDYDSFFEELRVKNGADIENLGKEIHKWSIEKKLLISWGQGKRSGSFGVNYNKHRLSYKLFVAYTYGVIETQFINLENKPPFDSIDIRKELLRRLNNISDANLSEDAIYRRPSIKFEAINSKNAFAHFIEALEWMIVIIDEYWLSKNEE